MKLHFIVNKSVNGAIKEAFSIPANTSEQIAHPDQLLLSTKAPARVVVDVLDVCKKAFSSKKLAEFYRTSLGWVTRDQARI